MPHGKPVMWLPTFFNTVALKSNFVQERRAGWKLPATPVVLIDRTEDECGAKGCDHGFILLSPGINLL